MTTAELAELLGVSARTVRRYLRTARAVPARGLPYTYRPSAVAPLLLAGREWSPWLEGTP